MSEYEQLVSIQHPDNTYVYDDQVRVIENSDEEDTKHLHAGKKKIDIFPIGNVIYPRMQMYLVKIT